MPHALTIPLGVVVAKERITNPWQEYRWRPVKVLFEAPPTDCWRELSRKSGAIHYHAATLDLTLHRKETAAYSVNLANGEPSIYVVMRDDPDLTDVAPFEVHLITASPFEAQSHGDLGFDHIEALVRIVADFIETHHVEQKFYKRKRDPASRAQEHQFGQEPLTVLRKRMNGQAQSFSYTNGAHTNGAHTNDNHANGATPKQVESLGIAEKTAIKFDMSGLGDGSDLDGDDTVRGGPKSPARGK